jgi:hypothetical protein
VVGDYLFGGGGGAVGLLLLGDAVRIGELLGGVDYLVLAAAQRSLCFVNQ